MPARRHGITLAGHLPQLHSSAAQSRVLGAARPFCFLGTASHSTQGCPPAPAISARGRAETTRENTGGGLPQSLKPVFSQELSPGLPCAQGPACLSGLPVPVIRNLPLGKLYPPAAGIQVSLEQAGM